MLHASQVDLQWFVNTGCAAKEEANLLDNAWILARMCPDKLFEITIDNPNQVVPSWTAFNISVATKNLLYQRWIIVQWYLPRRLICLPSTQSLILWTSWCINWIKNMRYLYLMRPYILRQRRYNGECQINSNTFFFDLENSLWSLCF